jgi:hypothetical protein
VDYNYNELENITGYTRQGLHFTFRKIDEGQVPTKRFINCVNTAIDLKIKEETARYEAKLSKLKRFKEKLNNLCV